MVKTAFIDVLVALLLVSALAHFFLTHWIDDWLSRPSVIRVTGAILLALAIVSLDWRGWFFQTQNSLYDDEFLTADLPHCSQPRP
jgi:protein-S-isoprenylcysteine O-methyltransferase Ste14